MAVEKFKVVLQTFHILTEAMSPEEPPRVITRDEFMRRMADMSKLAGGMMMGNK